MPLFSLITPIYNVDQYLPKCIESMINQSFKDIEIILVDDGSTDNSPLICDDYAKKDTRIKVIHKKNGGLVSARQAGNVVAIGDYIINVDGDDWIELNYCEKMAAIINSKHPSIVMSGYYKEYENDQQIYPIANRYGYYSRKELELDVFPILLQDDHGQSFRLSLWAKAIDSKLQKEQQKLVDVTINLGEDVACMAPCIFHSDSLFIMEDCLYHYRQNQDSMTKGRKVFCWDGPEKRGRHLEQQIDMNYGNMQAQLYRATVHSLFTVVKSQFNRTDISRKEIIEDIHDNLSRPYYSKSIKLAKFKGVKPIIMHLSLKYQLLWLIELFNMLHYK